MEFSKNNAIRDRKRTMDEVPASANFLVDRMPTVDCSGSSSDSQMLVKKRRKYDRFNGMPEEEVVKLKLPDLLTPNLDIVFIGYTSGLFAAYKGHFYADPRNHFWKCLHMSGLISEPMCADDDSKLLHHGIGFTNVVERTTKGTSDLKREEIRESSRILLEKLKKFQPKIAVFNGKLTFKVFSGQKKVNFGRQSQFIPGTKTYIWVIPSSSARVAQLPRVIDKVPYYTALKQFCDHLNGTMSVLDEKDIISQDSEASPSNGNSSTADVDDSYCNAPTAGPSTCPTLLESGITEGCARNERPKFEESPVNDERDQPKKIRPTPEENAYKETSQHQLQQNIAPSPSNGNASTMDMGNSNAGPLTSPSHHDQFLLESDFKEMLECQLHLPQWVLTLPEAGVDELLEEIHVE